MAEEPDQVKPPRVFVTYSHDSPAHKELVRDFATFLRASAGIDIHLDQWADDGRRDWSLWALEQIREADFILVIASPAYKRSAEGLAPPHEGRGSQAESALLRDILTEDIVGQTGRILPVVLPGRSVEEIPSFLRPYSATHYLVEEFTRAGVEDLLGAFSSVARHPEPPRGRFAGNPYVQAGSGERTVSAPPAPPGGGVTVNGGFAFIGGTVTNEGDLISGDKTVHVHQELP